MTRVVRRGRADPEGRRRNRPSRQTGCVLMLSPYPGDAELWDGSSFAVARYCQLLAAHLRAVDPPIDVTVLADIQGAPEEKVEPDGVRIRRVWAPRRLRSYKAIFDAARPHEDNNPDLVVHFEMAMFGSAIHGVGFAFLLLVLRGTGTRTVLVVHNATTQPTSVRGQLGLSRFNPRPIVYVTLLKLWYHATNALVTGCVTLEPAVAELLRDNGYRGAITVIPHGVAAPPFSPSAAPPTHREDKGPLRILVFGFPGWYKGTDAGPHLVTDPDFQSSFPHPYRLVIAGSPNPLHVGDGSYHNYLSRLRELCAATGTTYIPNVTTKDIPGIFADADLLAMPYRSLVGGSGVMSLAIEYRVPFAVSEPVAPWLDAPDAAAALRDAGLSPSDLVFKDAAQLGAIAARISDNEFRERVAIMLARLAGDRSWTSVATRYRHLLSCS
jgi:glycosyltransferase involved in cell wall biosynthesis